MRTNPECECKTCKDQEGQNQQDNPFASVFLGIAIFTAFMVCVLLYISCLLLDKNSSPPPVQFFLTTFLALLVFDAIIFQIAVNYFQWQAAQDQWNAMRDGLTQTRTLIKQGRENLEFTKSSFYLAERAYLSVNHLNSSGGTGPRRQLSFSFVIENGGRTPAFEFSAALFTAVGDKPDPTFWRHHPSNYVHPTDFLMPGSKSERIVLDGYHHMDSKEYDDWTRGDFFYFVKVELRYWDIGGKDERRAIYTYFMHAAKGGVIMNVENDVMPHRNRPQITDGSESDKQNG